MEIYLWLGMSVCGVLVWALRLEGRVNLADQKYVDLLRLIDSKFDAVNDRLDRIDRSVNGSRKDR